MQEQNENRTRSNSTLTHNTETFELLPVAAIKSDEYQSWELHPYLTKKDEDPPLQSEINRVVFSPPIVVQKDSSGHYCLLSDKIRFNHMKRVRQVSHVLCIVLPQDANTCTLLYYILCEQQSSSPLTLMEEAYFVHYGVQNMGENDFIHFFLPRLGYLPQKSTVSELAQLLTLEVEIQRLIHYGHVDRKTALDLLDLPSQDRIFLSKLFLQLQAGSNKQRRIIQLGQELAKRSSKSIIDLFSGGEVHQIIHHPEMNPPQKTHFLLNALQKKLNPRKHTAEQQFQRKINSLKLPQHVSVSHCQNFEKDEVFLTLKFSNIEELEKNWEKISHVFRTK